MGVDVGVDMAVVWSIVKKNKFQCCAETGTRHLKQRQSNKAVLRGRGKEGFRGEEGEEGVKYIHTSNSTFGICTRVLLPSEPHLYATWELFTGSAGTGQKERSSQGKRGGGGTQVLQSLRVLTRLRFSFLILCISSRFPKSESCSSYKIVWKVL